MRWREVLDCEVVEFEVVDVHYIHTMRRSEEECGGVMTSLGQV
jgi:hypothetical protein